MEVVYNVKYKFKTNDNKTKNEIKEIFNRKLLNIIFSKKQKSSAILQYILKSTTYYQLLSRNS